jgi:hypothetical protein
MYQVPDTHNAEVLHAAVRINVYHEGWVYASPKISESTVLQHTNQGIRDTDCMRQKM